MQPDRYTQLLHGLDRNGGVIYKEFYGDSKVISSNNQGTDLLELSLLKNHPDIRWNGGNEDDNNFNLLINSTVERLEYASLRNIINKNKEVKFFGFCNANPVNLSFYNRDYDYGFIFSRSNAKGSELIIQDCDISSIDSIEYLQEDGTYLLLDNSNYYANINKQGCVIHLIKTPEINYVTDNNLARSVVIKYTVGYNDLNQNSDLKYTILDCCAGRRNTDSQNALDINNIITQYARRISVI